VHRPSSGILLAVRTDLDIALMSNRPVPAVMSTRQWEIDALRGLMLVLMTLTHLPTRFASSMSQPFGYVSAAEGFVLLSAFVAAKAYTGRQQRLGDEAMKRGFYSRALKIWLVHAALLVVLFALIAPLGLLVDQPAVKGLISFYLERPAVAVVAALTLIYAPPLLDILPMYVLLMLVSPWLLLRGGRAGWGLIMAGSGLLWLGAQLDLGTYMYQTTARWARIPVPVHQTGAFELFGWQLLWVVGMWMGSRTALARPLAPAFPRWLIVCAWAFALTTMMWRHAIGQTPWPVDGTPAAAFNAAFDKWHLGPLRLLNLFALTVLALHHGPALSQRMRSAKVLERLGRASLPVFCTHLLLVLLALALFGAANAARPWSLDVSILAASFAVLYAVAQISAAMDRRAAEKKAARPAVQSQGPPPLNADALR
jgi:hypothetical protein